MSPFLLAIWKYMYLKNPMYVCYINIIKGKLHLTQKMDKEDYSRLIENRDWTQLFWKIRWKDFKHGGVLLEKNWRWWRGQSEWFIPVDLLMGPYWSQAPTCPQRLGIGVPSCWMTAALGNTTLVLKTFSCYKTSKRLEEDLNLKGVEEKFQLQVC